MLGPNNLVFLESAPQIIVGDPAGKRFLRIANKTPGSTIAFTPSSSGDAGKITCDGAGNVLVGLIRTTGAGSIPGWFDETTVDGRTHRTYATIPVVALPTPILLDGLNDTAGRTIGGSGTVAADATAGRFVAGTAGLNFKGNGTNAGVTATKTLGTIDPSALDVVAFLTSSKSDFTLASVGIALKPTAGSTYSSQTLGVSQRSFGSATRDGSQWQSFCVSEEPTIAAMAGAQSIDARITVVGNSPYMPDVTVDALLGNARGRPTLVLTFDDCHSEQYTVAFPYMEQYGIPGTIFVPPDFVGGQSNGSTAQAPLYNLTLAQIQALDAAGWCVGSDMSRNDDFIGSSTGAFATPSDVLTQYNYIDAWLAANTSGRGRGMMCYPNGAYDIQPPSSAVAALNTITGSTMVTAQTAPTRAVAVGDVVTHPAVPKGTTVKSITSATIFVLSNPATTGVTSAARFEDASSPFGFPAVTAILTGSGAAAPLKMGRSTATYVHHSRFGFAGSNLVHTGFGTSSKTPAQMLAQVDQAILRGGTVCSYTHSITVAGGSINTSVADFQAYIDGVAARRAAGLLDVLTIDQWYARDINGAATLPMAA